tara:strand:- start:1613 stop:1834 length:222 start_codon:yes stop_codon:yes gene_type:complete
LKKDLNKGNMKTIGLFLIALFFVSACSIKTPSVKLGKKCMIKGDEVVYSYVWIHDKNLPLQANKETCKQIEKN